VIILGTILIVLATIGVGLLVDRKWGVIPRKEKLLEQSKRPALPDYAPGEAPATALAASEAEPGEIEKLRRAKCTECRGETDVLPDDRVTYEGVELLVISTRCRRCGHKRAVYVSEGSPT
jgi:hypothetical protein